MILKITPSYSKEYIPNLYDASFPPPISQLYDPEALGMDYLSLLAKTTIIIAIYYINDVINM